LVGWQLLFFQGKPPAGVSETSDRALRLSPAENWNAPTRPLLDALSPGEILLLQPQQTDVPRVARGEAGALHVVTHEVLLGRKLVVLTLEECLLEIPARSPAQHRAHLQILAQNIPHHVLRI